MTNLNPLIGTWKLQSFELRQDDGVIKYPWGKEVEGQVIYGVDGYMAGSFMKQNRSLFESQDAMEGSAKEFESAMTSYFGYAGPYRLHKNRVFHHANVSLFPNWTGTDIERYFEVVEGILSLSTPTFVFSGIRGRAVLVWEKLPSL